MKKSHLLALFLTVCIFASCHQKPEISIDILQSALIPLPRKVTPVATSFVIDPTTKIYASTTPEVQEIAKEFTAALQANSGLDLEFIQESKPTASNAIHFFITDDESTQLNSEGYALKSDKEQLSLQANSPEGLYRGLQTLLQLLPEEGISGDTWEGEAWVIPGCTILDYPEYVYRGAMLDVARHFFPVKDVKRYIDLLAMYKINTLHLHLTDDQGWRIEIKSWPDLTTIGGKTAVGGGKGGFFTQEDYKEIVAYAASKYITIIPEIDMPGHTNAALVSYPELNCDGKPVKMYTGMRVGFSSFCVDKEITYKFVDDVIGELAAMTPGEYIHLGGDESHATSDEDYKTFLKKAFAIVQSHGKKVMGWEDIESAGIDENTIIQHWNIPKTAVNGAKQGAKVVLSPAPKTYLDMKYTKDSRIGLLWSGPTQIDSAYIWSPRDLLKDVPKDQIIGIESPLWTETVYTMDDIEYLAFPRVIGHAELGWYSGEEGIDWENYKSRLKKHLIRLKKIEVDFYESPLLE